jgi:hypothetical protein
MFQKLLNNNEQSVKWFKVYRVSKDKIGMMGLKVLLKFKACFSISKPYEDLPPVDLHWFFEISISAFISNWDKNSVIN